MRHLLAAAVLLCGPAMAVDYAKCEARNEAYGRVLAELKQALDNDFDAKLQSKRLAQCALGTPYVRAQCMKKLFLKLLLKEICVRPQLSSFTQER